MATLQELQRKEEFDQVWKKSKLIILFKHSTTCPISAGAFDEFNTFLAEVQKEVECYLVKVIESRGVSNYIAAVTDVKHESPQAFLIAGQEVLWHTSHSKITFDSLKNSLKLLD